MNALELPLTLLDRTRAAGLRAVCSIPFLRRFCSSHEQRIAVRFSVTLAGAVLLVMKAPGITLLLAPLVLGVPHLVSELRYLVLEKRLEARMIWLLLATSLWVALFLALSLVLKAGHVFDTLAVAGGIFGVALSALWRRDTTGRLLLCGLVLLVVFAPAPRGVVVLAHGAVSLLIWLLLFRKPGLRFAAWVVASVTVAALLVAWRAAEDRLVHVALLLQSIHYALWLSLIPSDAVRGRASFRVAARALVGDLGMLGIAIAGSIWLLVLASAIRDPTAARDMYLTLAEFHVYVEALVFVHLLRVPCFD